VTQEAVVAGCFEPPASPEVAIARWQKMWGQVGELYTGHALLDCPSGRSLVRTQMTRVQFAQVRDSQIAAYMASGEPLGCAGCFILEGRGDCLLRRLTDVTAMSLG